MISVLIPVFNYDVVSLVNTIHTQLQLCDIAFEIICLDDGSQPDIIQHNEIVSSLEFTTYEKSTINLGRTMVRQHLAEKASYEHLLFLDADVMPTSKAFIENYIKSIDAKNAVIYGGIAYEKHKPTDEYLLRWTYGKSYEQVTAKRRNKTPYKITVSANMLIEKSLFLNVNSQILKRGYGADTIFGAQLIYKNVGVLHIENAVFHLGIEHNAIYLRKMERATETLLSLYKNDNIRNQQNDLLNLYTKLRQFGGNHLFSILFKLSNNRMKANLLGKNPSMKILQFYKIGYMCHKDLNP